LATLIVTVALGVVGLTPSESLYVNVTLPLKLLRASVRYQKRNERGDGQWVQAVATTRPDRTPLSVP
jgi:hypothetical protein